MDLGGFNKPSKTGDTPTPNNKSCAIPMLNQVMSATKGATEAISGVTNHVNTSLRKLGAKNIESGFGFGHDLGVKPGMLNQIQSSIAVGVTKMMMKFGMIPNLPFGKGAAFQSGISAVNKNHISPATMAEQATQGLGLSQLTQFGSSFQSTAFKDNAVADSKFVSQANEKGGRVQSSENNILEMVLKHQRIIEELVEENEKLRHILVEDLKVPSSKLEPTSADRNISNSKGEDDRHKHNE